MRQQMIDEPLTKSRAWNQEDGKDEKDEIDEIDGKDESKQASGVSSGDVWVQKD